MKRLCTFVIALTIGATTFVAAQEKSIELSAAQIQANRKVIIKTVVAPTSDQEAAFWQTYWEYRGHIAQLSDRVIALIKQYEESYEAMDDETAQTMVDEVLAIDTRRANIRREYVKKFQKILTLKQVVRWYQIENRLDAMARVEMAASIPFAR